MLRTSIGFVCICGVIPLLFGCGGGSGGSSSQPSSACDNEAVSPGDHSFDLDHGGRTRGYVLHVPPEYSGDDPASLVVNFHGFTSNPSQQQLFSDMDTLADEEGFLVAYPRGVDNSWNGGSCCGTAADEDIDDVDFARAVVEDIASRTCIDRARVYATGMSNGGFLSHRLACETTDLFAAFAPVAGVLGIPPGECNPSEPVPIIHFHGTEDTLVPYDGSGQVNDMSVPETMAGWAERNGCNETSQETFREGMAHCETWNGCDGGVETTLCTVDGGGHCWPGQTICPFGGTTTDISANQRMWELFEQYP